MNSIQIRDVELRTRGFTGAMLRYELIKSVLTPADADNEYSTTEPRSLQRMVSFRSRIVPNLQVTDIYPGVDATLDTGTLNHELRFLTQSCFNV